MKAMMLRGLVALAMVIGVSLSGGAAKADTYLSHWKNQTDCDYYITNNGGSNLLPSAREIDLGPFPSKDGAPNVGKVEFMQKACTGPSPFALKFAGNFAGKRCGGIDPGPYKYTIEYDKGEPVDFCYCIQALRVAYLTTEVKPSGVSLAYGPGTYACGPQ